MTILVMIFGLLLIAMGLTAMISPGLLLRYSDQFLTQTGLYAAMIIRLVMGVVLILAAPETRVPQALTVFGVIIFISGVITPLIGLERARRMVAYITSKPLTFQRVWASMALAIGLFLIWAVVV